MEKRFAALYQIGFHFVYEPRRQHDTVQLEKWRSLRRQIGCPFGDALPCGTGRAIVIFTSGHLICHELNEIGCDDRATTHVHGVHG